MTRPQTLLAQALVVLAAGAIALPASAQEVDAPPDPPASVAPTERAISPEVDAPAVPAPDSTPADGELAPDPHETPTPPLDAGSRAQGLEPQARFRFEGRPSGVGLTLVTEPGYTRQSTFAMGAGEANGTGVTRVPREAYRSLCTSPCTSTLEPGIHTFGLTHPSGEVWASLPPLYMQADTPMLIRGTLVDHAGERLGGALFLVVGGLAGLGGMLAGFGMMFSSEDIWTTAEGNVGFGVAIGSGTLMLLAIAVGLPLAFYVDRAWVEGFPLE